MDLIPKRRPDHAVAQEYGHPWPWREPELVEQYAVDADVDLRELAADWGISYKQLTHWIREYGFYTEEYRAYR